MPELNPGIGTLDNIGVVSRDMISVRWATSDPESSIAAQYVSITSHLYGEFESKPVHVRTFQNVLIRKFQINT